MAERFINTSITNSDVFISPDTWLGRLTVNDYQVATIFWNIFLVIIPWFLGWYLINYWDKGRIFKSKKNLAFVSIILFLWLLFLPNTAYLISDIRHISNYCPEDPQFWVCPSRSWMVIFFFTYGAIGWVSLVWVTNQVRSWMNERISKLWSDLLPWLLMPLVSLGLLLGLVNRWNSWEIFIYPLDVFYSILTYFTDMINFMNWLVYTIFLYILYWSGNYLFRRKF